MQGLECFKCGFTNNFGNKFCTNCGERFQYSCPKCGSIIDPGIRFCSTCAAELDWGMPTQTSNAETRTVKQEENNQMEKDLALTIESSGKPRRNIVPFIIIIALLLVCIAAIFTVDIFLKY